MAPAHAQHRLWIMFHMMHLRSELSDMSASCTELARRILIPVLCHERVPLSAGSCADLVVSAKRSRPLDVRRTGADIGAPSSLNGFLSTGIGSAFLPSSATTIETFADEEDLPASISSKYTSTAVDVDRALRRLAATRGDVVRVLQHMPESILISWPDARNCTHALQIDGLHDVRAQASEILKHVFSSVIVVLPARMVSARHLDEDVSFRAKHDIVDGRVVAVATGFHHGKLSYVLSGIQTTLMLEAAVLAAGSHGCPLGGCDPVESVAVPLTALLEEEATPLAASSTWAALAAALPRRFGGGALLQRRRALHRARDALQNLHKSGGLDKTFGTNDLGRSIEWER